MNLILYLFPWNPYLKNKETIKELWTAQKIPKVFLYIVVSTLKNMTKMNVSKLLILKNRVPRRSM